MSSRILLVEDEPNLSMVLTDLLSAEGYEVDIAMDGVTGLSKALDGKFDLIVLDVMLPGKNGFDVCRELRQQGKDVAVLMLTARTQLTDRVVGLKLGADDYLVKPFEPPELLARIEALLRRVVKDKLTPVARFEFGNIQVNFENGDVMKNGVPISLATKEMELLRCLVNHRGNVVSRDDLLEGVWGYQPGVTSRTIDVHIAWLRQKLEDNPQFPKHIHTIRGMGYRFSA